MSKERAESSEITEQDENQQQCSEFNCEVIHVSQIETAKEDPGKYQQTLTQQSCTV